MGIKDLWCILQPYCERKPLYELQGKRVAIDLSGWVCQAQCIAEYQVQPKMYLRNLYFRTCFLVLHDVQTIFVLEGKAPKLKQKTIAARNELQFKGAAPKADKSQRKPTANQGNKGRSRFDGILRQCKEMLTLMGLACITGEGEAEAMCAYLNKEKLVEGCISQDSDCFAYGAHVVYRNFSISMQGNQTSSAGSVDVYNLNISKQEMDFGRNKVIALALICGSDYNQGVFGIGRDSALKYFASIPDSKILDEIRSWQGNPAHFEELHSLVNDPKKCNSCSHAGKKAVHTRNGCSGCGTFKGCNVNEEHANIRLGLTIRSKAVQDPSFPDEELLKEFLKEKNQVSRLDLKWEMPDLEKFIDFTRRHLQWEEIYAFGKLFPILTRWLITNPTSPRHKNKILPVPDYIKKKRTPKGIPSYEIIWVKDNLSPLIPPEQITIDHDKLFSSIEPEHLLNIAFPDLVEKYKESRLKPTKKTRGATSKNKKQKTGKTLHDFVNSKKVAEMKKNHQHDDSLFDDVDDNYDAELSLVVEEICTRGVPIMFQNKINQLVAKEDSCPNVAESSFFDFNLDESKLDAFERSMYIVLTSDSDDDI